MRDQLGDFRYDAWGQDTWEGLGEDEYLADLRLGGDEYYYGRGRDEEQEVRQVRAVRDGVVHPTDG